MTHRPPDPQPNRSGSRPSGRGAVSPRLLPLLLPCLALALLVAVAAFFLAPRPDVPPPENPRWITQDFLPRNPYSRPGDLLRHVNGIVIHYVGNPGTTARQNRSYFASLAHTHETYASSHFLVGLEGEVLQNIPLDEIAYCSNRRNEDTISIECCHPLEDGAFTQATTDSLTRLVRWLMDCYDLTPEQVIRHYDVSGKECPRYFVQHPEAWEAFLAGLT